MEEKRLYKLIQKYAAGTASPEEERELHQWYRGGEIGAVEWPIALTGEQPAGGPSSAEPGSPGQQDGAGNLVDPGKAAAGSADEDGQSAQDRPDGLGEAKEALRLRMLLRLQDQMHKQEQIQVYRFRGLRVAASIILVAAVAWIGYRYQRLQMGKNTEYVMVHNPSGKIQKIQLPDSTRVWLNAQSTLRYAKEFGRKRELYLDGEGYFDVVQDPGHPFIVHSGTLTTTVLGTVFNVRSFAGESQASVSVIRGKVQVQDSASVLDVLTPSRQLQLDTRSGKTRTVTVDTALIAGWQQGRLKFQGQNLEEITACLGRWYNVQFKFSNPGMRSCRYYLNFENTISLENLLTTIGEMNDMTFRIDQDLKTVTLDGRECQ
ncbi:FecR family protein [Flavitalea flava]